MNWKVENMRIGINKIVLVFISLLLFSCTAVIQHRVVYPERHMADLIVFTEIENGKIMARDTMNPYQCGSCDYCIKWPFNHVVNNYWEIDTIITDTLYHRSYSFDTKNYYTRQLITCDTIWKTKN